MKEAKVPPHANDIEENVLAAMLIDSRGLDEAVNLIKNPAVFYKPEHAIIFEVMKEMYFAHESVDLSTVCYKLQTNNKLDEVGGMVAVLELTQKITSSAHIEHHCRILLQFYIRRKTALAAQMLTAKTFDDSADVFELLRKWSNELEDLQSETLTGTREITIAEGLKEMQKRIERLSKNEENTLTGVHTGFKRINNYTGGYQPGDLVILAARPGMGKTSKVLKTVVENAKIGNACGFISLEMSYQQLLARIVAIDTNFHLKQLLKTGFEKPEYFDKLLNHSDRISRYPIYVDDGTCSDISDIILKARSWKKKYNLKLLVVDYLQLVGDSSKNGNRENEVSSVSRKLKLLAKELEIPIIVLAQLSRAVETRGGSKRPLLSDLRESGSIEQDADIVEFIYRPEYYNIEPDQDLIDAHADTEIIFAKYRAGSVGTSYLKWIGDKTKFIDPSDFNETEVVNEFAPIQPNQYVDPDLAF